MTKLRCVIMRGGTSKGVFFHENELPRDIQDRTEVILRVFGSPDKRQIDGLGGAEMGTSKVAIISPSSRNDADVDYVFGQVGINDPVIDFNGICGNLSAAVGPFAIDENLVKAKEPLTTVRVYCPNVNKYLSIGAEARDGKAVYEGDFKIDGVPGSGSRVSLDYSDTEGAITGHLLPTGNRTDELQIKGFGTLKASIIDVASLAVFVKASDLGLTGPESPADLDSNKELFKNLELIRCAVRELVQLKDSDWMQPAVIIAQKPVPWMNFASGRVMKPEDADILAKVYFPGAMHKAYPGTGCIVTGAASKMKGNIVNDLLSEEQKAKNEIIIGHFSGIVPVEVIARDEDGVFKLEKAAVFRTARRIMDGCVYI
jgi:methylitaconate Delta-isomerase